MFLWSDICCCLILNFRTCNLATQKSPLSQQNGKCGVSAEKGITSLSHCHRPGAQAQPQARGTDCSRQTSIRGRNRRKHRKRMLKRTLICLLTVWGGGDIKIWSNVENSFESKSGMLWYKYGTYWISNRQLWCKLCLKK